MEPTTLLFYAIVCGLLSVYAPKLGRAPGRFLIGSAVGIVAATVLPVIQGWL